MTAADKSQLKLLCCFSCFAEIQQVFKGILLIFINGFYSKQFFLENLVSLLSLDSILFDQKVIIIINNKLLHSLWLGNTGKYSAQEIAVLSLPTVGSILPSLELNIFQYCPTITSTMYSVEETIR